MSTTQKLRTDSAVRPRAVVDSVPREGWVGLARDQFDFALLAAGAWLRATEAARKAQWEMADLALRRHEDLRQRLRTVTEPAQLIALQVELMRFDSAAVIRSWQQIYDAAVEAATGALVDAKSTLEASQSDTIKSMLQAMQNLTHTGVRSVDDMFSSSLLHDLAMPPAGGGRVKPASAKANVH